MQEGKVCCVRCGKETFRHLLDGHRLCATSNRVVPTSNGVVAATSNADVVEAAPGGKKQGWDRVKYNEYMRGYMSRRRAEARKGV